ncbi:MAG TPA: DUF47 family protein [Longimicrobiaceae bacterium]|jgi:hypothetical protein
MRLRVHGQRFFDTFSRLAHIVTECARLQARLLAEPAIRGELVAEVAALEREASQLREAVVLDIEEVSIPPVDRGDVHRLASSLQGMVALLDENVRQVHTLELGPSPEAVGRLADVLVRAARRLEITVALLVERDTPGAGAADEMERLGEEADAISDAAVEALFAGSPDPLEAEKWKDLYDALTAAMQGLRQTERMVRNVVR